MMKVNNILDTSNMFLNLQEAPNLITHQIQSLFTMN